MKNFRKLVSDGLCKYIPLPFVQLGDEKVRPFILHKVMPWVWAI